MKSKVLFVFAMFLFFLLPMAHAVNPYKVVGAEHTWEQYGYDAYSSGTGHACSYWYSPRVVPPNNVTFTVRMASGESILNYTTYSHYYSGYSYFKIYVDNVYFGNTPHTSETCYNSGIDTNISDTNNHTITFECIGDVLNYCGLDAIYYKGYALSNPNYYSSNYDFDIMGYSNHVSSAFADLDNDGDMDAMILVGDSLSDALENIGSITSPTWYSKASWDIPTISCGSFSPRMAVGDFADLDNDGDMDYCYSCGSNAGGLYCYENNGSITNPSWNRKSEWDITSLSGSYFTMTFGDINGDNLTDVFINDRHSTVDKYMYVNIGNSTNPTWSLNNSIYIPAGASTSNFVDLDADGDLDFYSGYAYYENNGTIFNPSWSYNADYNLPKALTGTYVNIRFADFYRETYYSPTDPDFMVGQNTGFLLPYVNELGVHLSVPCTPDIQCSAWSSCYFEEGVRIKQRICYDLNNCTADEIEKTACDITPDPEESGDDFYSPTPPASFMMIPKIVIPATDNTAPNINSQTVTGFACFTNWYGYGDNMLDRMEYTINGITTTVYPNESHEPCGKGLNCPKPFGYIQTWDYLNKYFTQYDNYNTNLTVTCYDANGSTQSLSLTLNAKEEDYCYTTDDTVTKECFSFNDKMDNHIYSATDLNLKPTFAFDLDRITPAENTPDWQMYRVSTDIVNYFSSEAYTNDAKDSFNKIAQKEGYQIIELFTSPQDEAQVYFDVMFEDIYPKYFLFTDSDGQVQILLMFYNNEVYYFDGYRFKSMGAYTLNTPYTVEVDFDVDNQRFKLGLNTWHLYMDDSYNVYSWKKIGSWSYNNKIGTFITQIDDSKDIKYMAITLMSEFCNSDSDCSSVVGSPNYYAGTSSISPAFSDNWGFKQINQHLHKTDGSYLRYFDDKQEGNTGVMTINTWDDLENGIYNAGSLLSVIWESEGQGWWCYGTADKTVDVYAREGTGSWYYQDTMSISTSSSPQSYSRTINVSFDQIKFVFNISGATCWYSSRGSIDFDSVRATNITAGGERECRDIDWFADTFTNTSGNLEWAFDKSMNNSDFMLEWDDDIYTNLKLDRDTWDGGYCYSDMIIDNIETFTTRSTFHESEESSKKKKFTYEWLEKLGWNLEGNQGNISGDSGAYVSNYYDWDVCTKDGRQYNKGMWCMLNVHAQVLWDIVIGNIYGNFGAFLMFILLLALLSSFVIMLK